jgi:protein-disulfide isomerase
MDARKLAAVAALAAVASLGLLVAARLGDQAPLQTEALDLSHAPALGEFTAPTEIVLIESFTCPACRVFEQEHLPRVLEAFVESGQARLYFVHFQLDEAATLAGIAAECVRLQGEGVFWRYKELLYRTQPQGFAQERLLSLARDYLPGLDLGAFERCLVERRTEARVRSDYAMARALGIAAVPTVLVNGQPVSPNFYAIGRVVAKEVEHGSQDR